MSIRVIGYCDVVDKPRDHDAIVYFHESDDLVLDTRPAPEVLRAAAREHAQRQGYPVPSGKRGCSPYPEHFSPVFVESP